jgi:hypothetical protein
MPFGAYMAFEGIFGKKGIFDQLARTPPSLPIVPSETGQGAMSYSGLVERFVHG